MRSSYLIFPLLLLLVAATVPAMGQTVRIMPCGDSITYDNYSGDTRPESERISYRYPLWQLLTNTGADFQFVGGVYAGYDIIPDTQDAYNEGHGGWTDAQVASNIYNWLVASPADIVLLHIGTNAVNSSPGDVENILDEIDRYETDYTATVHVVLAKIINRITNDTTTSAFNTNIESMALSRVGDLITIVDMEYGAGIIYDYPANGGDMVDNLHPSDDGYAKMASVWFEALQTIMPATGQICDADMTNYWMMEKELPPYVNQFGAIARTADPPAWTTGQVGEAQLFDLTNEVDVEDDDSLDWGSSDSFTLEFWMKKTNPVLGTVTNNNEVILGRDDDSTGLHWWVGVAATSTPPGKACFQLRDTTGAGDAIFGTTVVQDGAWHHIAAVRDGDTGNNYLFVDGSQEASLPIAYSAGWDATDIAMNIGWLNLTPFYNYDGIVDEIAVHDRALDGTELAAHYVAGIGGLGYCTTGDIAPVITSTAITEMYSDEVYSYDVQAVGSPAPTFALLTEPAGMTIDPVTGLIGWTPPGTGDFAVEIEASNTEGTDTQSYTLSVTERPLCTSGLDLYWKLEETSGTTYADYLGILDAQALVSPPAPTTPGIVGDCQDFNGTSDFITVTDNAILDWGATQSFTIELWFNATNVASRNKVMIGRDEGGGTHWWLGLNQSTGYVNWNLLDSSRTGAATTGSTALNDGQWHHLVAVRDESLNQNRLYVDGGLVDSATHDYGNGFGASTTLGVGYMAYALTPDYFYDGLLDEVALYSEALSEPEILDHWNSGAGKSYCSEAPTAPVIVSTPVTTGVDGGAYTYNVNATGIPAPSYSLLTSPAGMTINSVTGVIDWLPTAAGNFDVDVQATNTEGNDTQFFTIAVAEGDDCPTDLSAYWKMNEASGTLLDWIGTADGTCSSCPSSVAGLIDGARWFDGSNEVNAPGVGVADWGPNDSFTISYWMRTDQSTAGNRVLIGRDDGNLHMWVGCDDNGTARFQLKEPGGGFVYIGGTGTVLNDNQWHYVVAIRDNDLDRNAIYVDNQLIDEATNDYTTGFVSGADFNIGYLNIGGHYRYAGAMDDLAIYNRALGDVEMEQLYQNGLEGLDLCTAAAPQFTSTPILEATTGQAYAYDADAVGTPAPTYSLTAAPAGMTIDPVTGVVAWLPAAPGSVSVVIEAVNSNGTADQPFTIDVSDPLPFPDCMVSWWRMDETAGPPYIDLRDGYDGFATNRPAPVAGKLGGALLFDGTDDEVDVTDVDQYEWAGDASFSIEFWMKTGNGGANHVIVGRDGGGASTVHWWVGALSDNTAYFGLRDSANQSISCASSSTVTDNAWHHIVAVRDGDLNTNQIWVDGAQENNVPGGYPGDFVCAADLNIGYLNLSGHYRYPGTVDELAIYCRALTEAEIMAHYNGGAGVEYSDPIAPAITTTPLLSVYSGQSYTYDVEATGAPTAVYGLTTGPAGMTIDYLTGIISWTTGATGDYDVTVSATNSAGEDTQIFTINVAPEPVCPPDMTNYWRLEETGGTTYLDFFAGLNGSASPAPPTPDAGGIVGGAQYFNGTSNYITVPDDTALDWGADYDFTIELWAKSTESTGTNQVMIGRDQGGGYPHWWLGVNNSGVPGWNMLDTNKNGIATNATETIWDGEWHHLVAVRDDNLNENRLYVDGELVGTSPYDYTAGFDATTTLGIGYMAYNGNPSYYYKGMLDEIALYTRALSLQDIQDHYLQGVAYAAHYCEDYLPPLAPTGFALDYHHLGNTLEWDDNTESDFSIYLVYRSQTEGFTPSQDNFLLEIGTSGYYDPETGMADSPFHYYYLIAAQDLSGNISEAVAPSIVTSVDNPALPTRFALHGNVPNPFNPMTTIKYELPVAASVSLRIFDISGRLVAVLKNNETETAGRHEVVWRGRDGSGQPVAAGVYFYRMETGGFNQTRRMVLVK